MTCDELQAEDRPFYDELIYMGEANDLAEGSFAETMNWVAMNEKYSMNSNQAGFGYVSDPACRESHGLDADSNSIMILTGFNSLPVHMTLQKDLEIMREMLSFELNNAIIRGTPLWSTRSYKAILDYGMTGIIFMMDENAFKEVKTHKDDWRAALMAEVLNKTQEGETEFITILHQYDDTEENFPSNVPSLA